jgi:hypothetical protein
LGFHGVPNAGKTALHTIIYRLRAFKGGRVSFDDDEPTKVYLAGCMNDLKEHRTIRANVRAKPDRLRWRLVLANKDVWNVEAMDFAGALVESGGAADAQHLADEVLTFLAECDALFLLLDCGDPDFRQIDAIDLLLSHLARRQTTHGSRRRPIALVWTKVDMLGPIDPDPQVNLARIEQRLGQHHIFQTIHNILAQETDEEHLFRQFPVSAFGSTAPDGLAPPMDQIRPYGIFEPLVWAATTSAEVIEQNQEDGLGEARRRVAQLRRRGPVFRGPDFAAMEQAYDDLLPAAQIDHPALAAAVKADRAAIRWQRRRAALKRKCALACLVLACLAAGWYGLRQSACARFDQVMQFRAGHPEDKHHAERRSRSERLLGSFWGLSLWLGAERRQRLRDGVAADLEVDYWEREAKEREGIVLAAKDMQAAATADKVHARCQAYDQAFPRTKHRQQIDAVRELARQVWRDQTWARAVAQEALTPTDYARVRALYNACLAVPANEKAGQARDAVARVERTWDQAHYLPLYQAMLAPKTWADLGRAEQLAGAYLNADRPFKKMATRAKSLQQWVQTLRGGRAPCALSLESVVIPFKSPIVNLFGADSIEATLSMGGQTARTVFVRPRNGAAAWASLGSLPFPWGQAAVSLQMKNKERPATVSGSATLSSLFAGKGYAWCSLNDGSSAKVVWSCPALDVSRHHLPPY